VLTFTTLVIADLGLILANRARSGSIFTAFLPRNRALNVVLAGSIALLVLVIVVPRLRQVFGFGVVHPDDLLVIVIAALAALLWLEVLRLASRRPKHVSNA
jgi:Ca2+-transporting ATPase